MKAIDTNVLVRFLTQDDAEQAGLAARCIDDGVFVSHGVLMEAEWVLRRAYGWSPERINEGLRHFLAIRDVETERVGELHWALDRHRAGADWADMLHLIAASRMDSFVTFDRQLVRLAADGPLRAELLA